MKSGYLSFLLLVLVSGCGSQDRYEVMAPEAGFTIEDGNWGTVTQLSSVHNSLVQFPAAVVNDQFYCGSTYGMIYRETSSGYEVLPPLPDGLFVRDLIEGPDGLLWMTDSRGRVLFFEDGQWTQDVDLDLGTDSGSRLLLDDQERMILYAPDGRLWRRDHSGQWSSQDVPGNPGLAHGWCEFGQPPVFVSKELHLITEGADGWETAAPLIEGVSFNFVEVQGSEDGRLAVKVGWGEIFLLNEGEGWQIKDAGQGLYHLFWLHNELYGISRPFKDLVRWDGENWTVIEDCYWSGREEDIRSFAHGSSRRLHFSYGETRLFDGLSQTQFSPQLTWPSAYVQHEGQYHMYMRSGQHLMGGDGDWEYVGRPTDAQGSYSNYVHMLVDDREKLLFLGSNSLVQWNEGQYQTIPIELNVQRFYQQEDGKIVVISDDQVGVWSGGELRWIGDLVDSYSEIRGAFWESENRAMVVSRSYLSSVEPEQSAITLTFQGWSPSFAAAGPGQSIACGGLHRVIVVDGTLVQDITPFWGGSSQVPASLSTLVPDGFGGWLAYDYERYSLLRFDGRRWLDMRGEFAAMIRDGGTLTSNRDGTFILRHYGYVFLVEPEVVP